MPWQETSVVERRREFVRLAAQEGANRRELCRRFGVHPDTGYKWISRFEMGDETLEDRSRRPSSHPAKSPPSVEADVLAVRDAHPAWGARKIASYLTREGKPAPAPSTVHAILLRNDRIVPPPGGDRATTRFEKAVPNRLWQMDYKGWVRLADGTRCHPLTMIDDHSRFVPCLEACLDQTGETVRKHLESTFRIYGLPDAFFVDNGGPWGRSDRSRWTKLNVWLLKLGIRVLHSRPYHPESRGKNERFHRTLKAEVFAHRPFRTIKDVQHAFNLWREIYNHKRPHEALDLDVPASRYRPSPRSMPDHIPKVDYDSHETVRIVGKTKTYISFKGQLWKMPEAFAGESVAIRPLNTDGQYGIYFGANLIGAIDLTNSNSVGHVSEQVSAMSPG